MKNSKKKPMKSQNEENKKLYCSEIDFNIPTLYDTDEKEM